MSELKKGIISRVDHNDTKLQTVQTEGFNGEVTDSVERYQGYGISTYPSPVDNTTGYAAEVIIAELNSNDLNVVIATDDRRYRPTVGFDGDTIIYTKHDTPTADHNGATHRISLTDDGTANYRTIVKTGLCKVELKNDGTITITNGNGTWLMAPNGNTTITCPTLTINANIATTGTLTNNGVNISSTHVHSGVTAGSASTGVPS